MKINYLTQKEIDKKRWNAALDRATNGLVYAYSWYLDCVAENWDALVSEDYKYIMPLPWNDKWLGVKQIYQPIFTQQLGVFGEDIPTEAITELFLKSIPTQFKYVHLQLNETNKTNAVNFEKKERVNMILDLNREYSVIRQNYRKSLKSRLNQIKKNHQLQLKHNAIDAKEIVAQYKFFLNHKIGLNDDTYQRVEKLIETALKNGHGNIYSAHTIDTEEFAAAIFFPTSHGRMVQLLSSNSSLGRRLQAQHFIIDEVIQKFTGHKILFDFEGSEIPGVAKFFRGFGAAEVYYTQIIKDDFPFWIKGIQKLREHL